MFVHYTFCTIRLMRVFVFSFSFIRRLNLVFRFQFQMLVSKTTIKNRFAFFFHTVELFNLNFFFVCRRCASNAFVTILMSWSVVEYWRQHADSIIHWNMYCPDTRRSFQLRWSQRNMVIQFKWMQLFVSFYFRFVSFDCDEIIFCRPCYGISFFVTTRFNGFNRSKCIGMNATQRHRLRIISESN